MEAAPSSSRRDTCTALAEKMRMLKVLLMQRTAVYLSVDNSRTVENITQFCAFLDELMLRALVCDERALVSIYRGSELACGTKSLRLIFKRRGEDADAVMAERRKVNSMWRQIAEIIGYIEVDVKRND